MVQCTVCGNQTKLGDNFCGNCGARLNSGEIMLVNGTWPVNFPGKQSTNFFNGFKIGLSLCIVVACTSLVLWLSQTFWTQRAGLIAQGMAPAEASSRLYEIVGNISIVFLIAVFSAGIMIFAVGSQFSRRFRTLTEDKASKSNWGMRLISTGSFLVFMSLAFAIQALYGQSIFVYWSYEFVAGITLILLGSALAARTYLRNQRQQQSLKQENPFSQ